IFWHFLDERARDILVGDGIGDESRLAIIVGQRSPQPLVNLFTAAETAHLTECGHGLAGVFSAVGVDLTGRGVSSVQQYLKFHEQWCREAAAPPFRVVHALETDIVRGGRVLLRRRGWRRQWR